MRFNHRFFGVLCALLFVACPQIASAVDTVECSRLKLKLQGFDREQKCLTKNVNITSLGVSGGKNEIIIFRFEGGGGAVSWSKVNPNSYLSVVGIEDFFAKIDDVVSKSDPQMSDVYGYQYIETTRAFDDKQVGCNYFLKYAGYSKGSGRTQQVYGQYCDGRAPRVTKENFETFLGTISIDDAEFR
ncbi:MAG: hypothetical protein ACPGO3_07110 [Magnetospiraceae bacterium]